MRETAPRRYIRISDLLMDAFDEAVRQREVPVAEVLHTALELVMTRRAGPKNIDKRDVPQNVLETYERLEALRREAQG